MILNLNKTNKDMVCKALAQGIKYSYYNKDCFSSGDIRRHIDLTDDVSAIILKIAFYGVNLKEELLTAFKDENVEFKEDFLNNAFDGIERNDDDYDIKINSHSIWRVVRTEELKSLFSEGRVAPIDKELYTIYDSEDMFVPIIKLNLNNEGAIEYLLEDDAVFSEAYTILDKELESYIAKEVICIKESRSSKDIGSEIRIKYSNYKETIYAIVNERGTKSDILLIKDNLIYKIIPLEKNVFGKKSIRKILSKEEVIKYQAIVDEYDKADSMLVQITNRLMDNLNLSGGENYAYSFVDAYTYDKYKEVYNDDIMEIDDIKDLESEEDITFLSEEEYDNLRLKKQELDKVISVVKDVIVGEDLKDDYKKSRIELATSIVQYDVESKCKLCRPKYTDVGMLLNRFDDLIRIN